MIDSKIANSMFRYDGFDGVLRWGFSSAKFKAGEAVGTHTSSQNCHTRYLQVRLFGEMYKVHRIVWLMKTGEFPKRYIDHIDGDGLNNSWDNLREATPSQNMMNQRVRSDSESGVKGVSFDKSRKKWYAYINVDGKRKMLGRHETLEEAAGARLAAERLLHGGFSRACS